MATQDNTTSFENQSPQQETLFPYDLPQETAKEAPVFVCSNCGEKKKYFAKELCNQCYQRSLHRRAKNDPRYRQFQRLRGRGQRIPNNTLTPSQKEQIGNQPCGLCGKVPTPDRPSSIDHDHATGRIRGPLCPPCNGNIAPFEKYGIDEYANMVRAYLAGPYEIPPIDYEREEELVKGKRGNRGEKHPLSKLKDSDIPEIRWLCRYSGWSQKAIAERYGVVKGAISNIHGGHSRIHNPGVEKPSWWDDSSMLFASHEAVGE
jgi:hypothetical protein